MTGGAVSLCYIYDNSTTSPRLSGATDQITIAIIASPTTLSIMEETTNENGDNPFTYRPPKRTPGRDPGGIDFLDRQYYFDTRYRKRPKHTRRKPELGEGEYEELERELRHQLRQEILEELRQKQWGRRASYEMDVDDWTAITEEEQVAALTKALGIPREDLQSLHRLATTVQVIFDTRRANIRKQLLYKDVGDDGQEGRWYEPHPHLEAEVDIHKGPL